MGTYWSNFNGSAPGFASIIGDEGVHDKGLGRVQNESNDRHNHSAAGLNEWLSADAKIMVGRSLCRAPRFPTIMRGAHLDLVARGSVVELGIAVPVEGAAGCIVAGGPILVVKMTCFIHRYRTTPVQPPISRTVDDHIDRSRRGHNAQGGDQPDLVLGIIGHR